MRPAGTFAAIVNIAGATPMLLGLVAQAVAAHGLDPCVFQIPVDSENLPAMVESVFGRADVERHDNALVFDSPEPVAAYAISCLSGYGVEPDHPLHGSVAQTILSRAAALFAEGGIQRDPKGYVVVRAAK